MNRVFRGHHLADWGLNAKDAIYEVAGPTRAGARQTLWSLQGDAERLRQPLGDQP